MPEISKIKISNENGEEEIYDLKDTALREALAILLGEKKPKQTIEENGKEKVLE